MKLFNINNKWQQGALAMLCLCLSSMAHAAIDSASGNASVTTLNADDTNNTAVVINWTLASTPNGSAFTSNNATIITTVPNTVVGSTLSGTNTAIETVNFSPAQIQSWYNQNFSSVTLRRVFTDPADGMSANGDVTLTIIKPSGSARSLANIRKDFTFAIHRLSLSFNNQTNITTTAKHTQLHAFADIYYQGKDQVDVLWQIAEPQSTQATPIFRNLNKQTLVLNQSQHSRVKSPLLPTNISGKYLLRFCIIDRQANQKLDCVNHETVMASYDALEQANPVEKIMAKASSQLVNSSSTFAWPDVNNAVVYQLEVYAERDGEQIFITGILLPKQKIKTALSKIMKEKLSPNAQYYWGVNALDQAGQVIAKSELQRFTYMAE